MLMWRTALHCLLHPLFTNILVAFHIFFGGNSYTACFCVSKFLSNYYSNYSILACIFPRNYATVKYQEWSKHNYFHTPKHGVVRDNHSSWPCLWQCQAWDLFHYVVRQVKANLRCTAIIFNSISSTKVTSLINMTLTVILVILYRLSKLYLYSL